MGVTLPATPALPSHPSEFTPGSAPPAGTPAPPQAAPGGRRGDRSAACTVPFRWATRCPGAGRACSSGRKAGGAGGVGAFPRSLRAPLAAAGPGGASTWLASLCFHPGFRESLPRASSTESLQPSNHSSGRVPGDARCAWPVSLISCNRVSPVPSRRDGPHEEAVLPSSCPPGHRPRAGISQGQRLRSDPRDHPSPPPHALEAAGVPAAVRGEPSG